MKKINIGLDIGIASVGWSIIDEEYNIVDSGVRLFPDVADAKTGKLNNVKRREARSLRRRIRRERTRKDALINFFIDNNLLNNEEEFYLKINKEINNFEVNTISELKEKMLKEKLDDNALIITLFNYVHNRGYFYLDDEEQEKETKNKNKNSDVDKDENVDVKDKKDEKKSDDYYFQKTNNYPSIQLNNFYKKYGFYKGSFLGSRFSHLEWEKEIIKLLEIQGKDSNFKDSYLKIFNAVREYNIGPGSEKSPTPYGLWNLDPKTGKSVKHFDNLWDKTIGKCTIYPEINRGMKNSPIAEIFNLLNDLNNIHFDNKRDKLSKEEKEKIFKELSKDLEGKKISSINDKKIAKILNIDVEEIEGLHAEKKVSIANYVNISKWLIENNLYIGDKYLLNLDMLNKANVIFDSLTQIKDLNKRAEMILNEYKISNIEDIKIFLKRIKGLSQTHAFSYKAMKEYIDVGINEHINQMELFKDKILHNRQINKKNSESGKYIQRGLFNDEIISPTTRRSFNQTIAVINKIIKVYGNKYEIDHITIEMARDKNTAQQRKNIEKMQKNNKNEKKKILELKVKTSDKDEDIDKEISNAAMWRLILWNQQNKCDIYDGEEISYEKAFSGEGLEVDHIIPFSISMDNSLNNKVLTKGLNNKAKDNDTPYQWLSSEGKYEEYKMRVEKTYDNKKYLKKKNNLLDESDPSGVENIRKFVGRNLVDTRYASRLVLQTLDSFFKDKGTVINVINGKITNYCLNNVFISKEDLKNGTPLKKDRDFYKHHAIDASVVGFLGMNHKISKLARFEGMINVKKKDDKEKKSFEYINIDTGEVMSLKLSFDNDDNSQKFKHNLIKSVNNIKFSRMLLKRKNIPLSNETIRGFRKNGDEYRTVDKISIITSNAKELSSYFKKDSIKEKDVNSLLVYLNDKYLYNKLLDIFNKYWKDEKTNPFILYMEESYPEEMPIKRIRIDNQYIKNLKIYGGTKKDSNIILLKNHKNNAFLESLNWKEIRVYKNILNKYVSISINMKILKNQNNKLIIDKEKLNNLLKEKKIINSNHFILHKGTIFISKNDSNDVYYMVGSSKENNIEYKPISFALREKEKKNDNTIKRLRVPVSTIVSNFNIAEIDVLGNIYNQREIIIKDK